MKMNRILGLNRLYRNFGIGAYLGTVGFRCILYYNYMVRGVYPPVVRKEDRTSSGCGKPSMRVTRDNVARQGPKMGDVKTTF